MDKCTIALVVGPKFHLISSTWNPTGNFFYFRGNLYDLFFKQMFPLPSFPIPFISYRIRQQHIFLLDGWTDIKCWFASWFFQCASTRVLMICSLCNHSWSWQGLAAQSMSTMFSTKGYITVYHTVASTKVKIIFEDRVCVRLLTKQVVAIWCQN